MSELKIPDFGELLAPFISQVPEGASAAYLDDIISKS